MYSPLNELDNGNEIATHIVKRTQEEVQTIKQLMRQLYGEGALSLLSYHFEAWYIRDTVCNKSWDPNNGWLLVYKDALNNTRVMLDIKLAVTSQPSAPQYEDISDAEDTLSSLQNAVGSSEGTSTLSYTESVLSVTSPSEVTLGEDTISDLLSEGELQELGTDLGISPLRDLFPELDMD